MIKSISYLDLDCCADIIRKSFATVAKEFDLTVQNCPTNGAFISVQRLQNEFSNGNLMFSYHIEDRIIGFFEIAKKIDAIYELEKLAVLPEYRHIGCGKKMIDFCKAKVKELGGNKIVIGIIEENSVLKNWYIANGFVHTGTRKFEHLPFTVGFMEYNINLK